MAIFSLYVKVVNKESKAYILPGTMLTNIMLSFLDWQIIKRGKCIQHQYYLNACSILINLILIVTQGACSVPSLMSNSVTLWTIACQTPLSLGFSRDEYWSGLPGPPPGGSFWPRDWTWVIYISCIAGRLFTAEPPRKPITQEDVCYYDPILQMGKLRQRVMEKLKPRSHN